MVHKRNRLISSLLLAILYPAAAGFGSSLAAQDAQWRGPERNGIYHESGLLKSWPSEGPPLLLQVDSLGRGFSTPVLYEGSIYISGTRDSLDVLTCLDLQGDIIWEKVYGMAWDQSYPENRSTPAIAGGRIYIMAGLGVVVCMDTKSGEIIWERDTHSEFKGEYHRWGMAESLLITDEAVISSPVGEHTSVVALSREDGKVLWESEPSGGVRAYASPLLIEQGGRPLILVVSSQHVMAVDPSDGAILWKEDIVTGFSGERGRRNNTNTPLYKDGMIFVNSGYDAIALMFRLNEDGSDVELAWTNNVLDTHHGGVVLVDGYIYGSNWVNNGNGNWACVEWESGETMYEETWNNKGSVIYADGMLYIYEEKRGNVGLVRPDPKGFDLISSFRIEAGSGPHWAHMSIYDKKLFVRHGGSLMVYDIAATE
jgi:outer membrane protein assembly factor BamB